MAVENAEQRSPGPRTSMWALASLLFSLALFCGPVGILLGARALVEIKSNSNIRGRGLALAGITIGCITSIAILAILILWHFNARVPMMNGPAAELQRGLAGDIASFKSGFTAAGRDATDAEAGEFLTAIKQRYGSFTDSRQNPQSTQPAPKGDPLFRISYIVQFSRRKLDAEAAFRTFGTPRHGIPSLHFAWEWIRIVDSTEGDLIYPRSAESRATAAPAPANNP